jgi:hypothetical protein
VLLSPRRGRQRTSPAVCRAHIRLLLTEQHLIPPPTPGNDAPAAAERFQIAIRISQRNAIDVRRRRVRPAGTTERQREAGALCPGQCCASGRSGGHEAPRLRQSFELVGAEADLHCEHIDGGVNWPV